MKSSAKPLIAFCALVLAAAFVQQLTQTWPREAPHTPQPLPPLMVQGWLNTDDPPKRESLAGKWVVVAVSSLDCRTCRIEEPRLVRLHRAVDERDDIAIIGIDNDMGDSAEAIAAYVASVPGYDWPIGHGAAAMGDMLGIRAWPTLVLFGPDGQSVWRGHYVARLAEQLRERAGVDLGPFEG